VFVDAPAVRRIVPCAVGLCLAWLSACSDGPGQSAKHLPRQGDASLVVYVEAPDDRSVEFIEEVEPNGEPDQATPVALGTLSGMLSGVRGALDGETDSDVYQLNVERDGFLSARLSGVENVDLLLEVLDAKGEVLAISDRGPAMTVEGVPNFHVTAGRYYVAVREFVKKRPKPKKPKKTKRGKKAAEPVVEGRQGLSPVYELVLGSWPKNQPRQENEPNDNRELANEVLLGDQVTGYMGWARDADVWKLSLEGFTAHYGLNIELTGVPGASLQLQIFDERGGKVLERAADKDAGLSVRNLVAVAGESSADSDDAARAPASGFYYVQVSARRSNPVDAYQLRMNTRLLEPDEEIEPNDEPKDAQILELDHDGAESTRRGHLTPSDVDRYALTAGVEPLSLSVLCAPLSDIDVKLEVTVDGATLGSSNEYRQSGKESLPDLRLQAGRTAIISVSGEGELEGEAGYQLSVITESASGPPLGSPDGPAGGDELLDEYRDEPERPE
jgi:hypothetical protein